jgi:hypothetical protein
MRKRISGLVSIKVEIDETGAVTEANILCGGGLLASLSSGAALKWRFTPATINGQPVKSKGVLTFNFILQ